MEKRELIGNIEPYLPALRDLAFQIFDHPEQGYEERFACGLLCDFLEKEGFAVERGVGGIETAFRATWEYGEGGIALGFLGEYDALEIGHACGHHLQTPAAIGAALLFKDHYRDRPFKLIIYGTPAEETTGGKIIMAENGCFRDMDLCFSNHTSDITCVRGASMALGSSVVTYTGTPSHAGASPEKGRSALDALQLAFHGLECLREHVKTGSRIHYTLNEGTGMANIVHPKAVARVTCRAASRTYLDDMLRRVRLVLEGAAMMTETTVTIETDPPFANVVPSCSLERAGLANAAFCGAPKIDRLHTAAELKTASGGATDFGNVSWITPGMLIKVAFSDAVGHSPAYVAEGKKPAAVDYIRCCAQIMAGVALDFLTDEGFRREVRDEFAATVAEFASDN